MSIRDEMMVKAPAEQVLGAKLPSPTHIREAPQPATRPLADPAYQRKDMRPSPTPAISPKVSPPVPGGQINTDANIGIGPIIGAIPCDLLPQPARAICEAAKGLVPSGPETPFVPSGPPTPQQPIPLQMGACPSGYHLNKTSYFLKDGTFVPARSKCVKNRRRNPLNPHALNRATSRLLAYDKNKKRVERAIKKATPRPAPRRRRAPSKPCGCSEGATIVKA